MHEYLTFIPYIINYVLIVQYSSLSRYDDVETKHLSEFMLICVWSR